MLPLEHSAILSSFIKLLFVIRIFVLSIFEWPFYTGFMQSLVKIKLSQNDEITLSFTYRDKSCPIHDFLMCQIYLLTQFPKIIAPRKFPNLQYVAEKALIEDY